MPIVYSFLAALLWGFWGVGAKLAADRIGHWPSALVYTVFSMLSVGLLFLFVGATLRDSSRNGILLAAAAGVLGGLAILCFLKALSTGPVSTATAISALYPVIPVVFGLFLLGEKLTATKGAGIILALAAAVLISI